MEFTPRGGRTAAPDTQTTQAPSHPHPGGRRKHIDWVAKTVRFELFIVIVGSALLLSAVSLWLATGNYKNAESEQVNTKEDQAVFLTNSQVYFGKVTDLNSKFVVLNDVFYIENQQNTASQSKDTTNNTNYTLRKLGATELHAPENRMVINRDQVTFWENLKDSGQVVTKIKEYNKNPSAANQQSSSPSPTPSASQSTTPNKP
ncbi:hypothetical protein COU91_02655 [Candidatus Saccharibacteria bacterium CG10_big_fil_rev_8_21_14_0_10_47_8]|nr:MAG: hypothetical protein COU91_02655 [Candidatus Saccharibacteria bacterium CG10_big_fil_rev_8_21_14_0_10_47_8]